MVQIIANRESAATEICNICNRNLFGRPAFIGTSGLQCFLCRYMIDVRGGERYLSELPDYRARYEIWAGNYGKQWEEYELGNHSPRMLELRKRNQLFRTLGKISIFIAPIALWLVLSWSRTDALSAIRLVTIVGLWIGVTLTLFTIAGHNERQIIRLSTKPCPGPPKPPDKSVYNEYDGICDAPPSYRGDVYPEMRFNQHFNSSSIRAYDNDKTYPPDWESRRQEILERDGKSCVICGEQEHLHIHHVRPISWGGCHTPQNLITLCRNCHEQQFYFDHQDLVEKAVNKRIRLWRSRRRRLKRSQKA